MALLMAAAGCATDPVTGQQAFVLISERDEIDLGRRNDAKIRQQYGVYDDARLQAYVERVGQQLAARSHRPGIKYHFTVLDADEVNAFALPGGYVYITRGILAYLNSEAELAAVLGHEIGHVTARHGVEQLTTQMAIGLGIGVLTQHSPALQNQMAQQLLDLLGTALVRGYGREDELESDRLGAEYLARTSYDPDAMLEVIGVLKNQEEFEKRRAAAEGREPQVYHGVFATHPSSDERLQKAVGEAKRFKTAATSHTGRDAYLDLVDGLVFGDGPRQGIVRGHRFYHRDLDLVLDFPADWRLNNTPGTLVATTPDREALIQVEVARLKEAPSPQEYLRRRLPRAQLRQEAPLAGSPYPAHTALATLNTPYGPRDTRLIVLHYRDQALLLFATARSATAFAAVEPQARAVAGSLRPLRAEERRIAEGLRINVIRAPAGTSFGELARGSPLGEHAESLLRLINDRFPTGQPKAGERIKVIH